jgi:hypothetical protein
LGPFLGLVPNGHYHSALDASEDPRVNAITTLRCSECGRSWLDTTEPWRSYVADEDRDREFDGPDVSAVFCPECAEAEFGPPC